jgi:hypothetical protein
MTSPVPDVFETTSRLVRRRSHGFRIGVALVMALVFASLGTGSLAPSTAQAQTQPDPLLEVWLHNTFVAVRTASLRPPKVKLFDAERNAIGRASAGLPVTVEPLDESGQPRAIFEGIVKPTSVGGLPSFEVPLFDFYPDGVKAGDQMRLGVGGRSYLFDVPDFEWQADVLTDSVIGRGPANLPLAIVAYARDMSVRRADTSITQGVIGPRGIWGLGFGGFDLRAGDDLELYLFDAEKFLWWSEDAIAGPIEPTPVPTARPTIEPTSTPEPTPTAEPQGWMIYLPRAERS